jgi:hypothetical protein
MAESEITAGLRALPHSKAGASVGAEIELGFAMDDPGQFRSAIRSRLRRQGLWLWAPLTGAGSTPLDSSGPHSRPRNA